MKKEVAILLIVFTLLVFPLNTAASSPQNSQSAALRLEDCMNMAVEYSHQLAVIDQQIDSLRKQENDLMEASNGIQQQLDLLERYRQLYEKWTKGGTIDQEDQINLMTYQAMFGDKPPEYTSKEMFDNYIKNRDFPHYSVWASIQNLQKNREATVSSIKMGVKQLYDAILDLQDVLSLQQDLYATMKKQNDQMLLKYKKGMVSEIDKYSSEVSLEKQRLSVEKLKRSLDSQLKALKSQIGTPLNQNVVLLPTDSSKWLKDTSSLQNYIDTALKNRVEVMTAKMDLQVKQREDDIMKQYITAEQDTERMEVDQALEDKSISYADAVNKVTADITYGYKDIQLKKSNYDIALGKFLNSSKQYKNAQLQYDRGVIGLADLWNLQISYTQAKQNYNKAIRDYNNAVYKLETACGIGPGYITGMGGI